VVLNHAHTHAAETNHAKTLYVGIKILSLQQLPVCAANAGDVNGNVPTQKNKSAQYGITTRLSFFYHGSVYHVHENSKSAG